MRHVTAILVAALVGWSSPADAHRLDEYLQATRVAIDVDRVSVEIDLTPGATVAARVFALIDTDHDGRVSDTESERYARAVLGSIHLNIDGRRVPLTMVAYRFPGFDEMRLGIGVIRLSATARAPGGSGRHQLVVRNTYLPDESVYAANALAPTNDVVEIDGQRRDPLQQGLIVDYRVGRSPWAFRAMWSLAGLMTVGIAAIRKGFGTSGRATREFENRFD